MPGLVKEDEKGTKKYLIPYLPESVKTLIEENKVIRKKRE
jgi:hypothetical protein